MDRQQDTLELCAWLEKHLPVAGIWKLSWIRENRDFFLTFLSEEEKVLNQKYCSEKMSNQFLSGRILAKICLNYSIHQWNHIGILKKKSGKPFLKVFDKIMERPFFSLTHKEPFIVVAADCDAPLGIDLEKVGPKPKRVKKFFVSADEEIILEQNLDLDEEHRLTLLWAAKEALVKLTEWDFFRVVDEIKLVKILDESLIFKSGNKEWVARGFFYRNYYLCVARQRD